MNANIDELSQLINAKSPELAAALLPGASLDELSRTFGASFTELPADLKALWAWRNGQAQDYFGNFHATTNEMLMSFENAYETRLELNEYLESGDLDDDNWQSSWLPFTENGGGNYMCLSLETGEIYYFDKYKTATGLRFSTFDGWLRNLIDDYKRI